MGEKSSTSSSKVKKKKRCCPCCGRKKKDKSEDLPKEQDIPVAGHPPERRASRRPKDNAFEQQRLRAWEPILNAGSVYKQFFLIGLISSIVGTFCVFLSETVWEMNLDYTECMSTGSNTTTCAESLKINWSHPCNCTVVFDVHDTIEGDIYLYYSLVNFYQNHRKYVKSRDDRQILGYLNKKPSDDCEPFRTSPGGKLIAPCGAIANSMFNDTIRLFHDTSEMELKRTGIAWEWDKRTKFANPKNIQEIANFDKPNNWRKGLLELDPHNEANNGFQNEDLIVWMRTAALPTFRKLHRIILGGLGKGDYHLQIEYNFLILGGEFRKSVILSRPSMLGGKNPSLGYICCALGIICILFGILFFYLSTKRRPYRGSI